MRYTDFENGLRQHLFIEIYFKHRNLLLIESQKDIKLVCESYGVNREVIDIANEIENNLNLNKKINIINVNTSFVDKITVYFNTSVEEAAYWPEKSELDENGKYNNMVIVINPNVDKDDLFTCLVHELTHAFQDYNLRLKDTDLTTQMKKHNYFRINSEYIKSNDPYIKLMAKILYIFNGYKKGAFISEIKSSLKDKYYFTIEEVMTDIKNNQAYKMFIKSLELCDEIVNSGNYGYMNAASKITGKQFNTYNQFSKWLNGISYSMSKKLERFIPKIAGEHVKMVETMAHYRYKDLFEE